MKKTEAISILATSVRPREAKDRARYDEAVKMAIEALKCSEIPNSSDSISRQAAIDLFPDDDLEYDTKGGYIAPHLARQMICELSSVQPDLSEYSDKLWKSAYERGKAEAEDAGWIPCSKRLPAVPCCRCLITRDNGRGEATVEEALFSFGKWYDNEWFEDGRSSKFDISASVIAWAPFPAPYRGGEK